MVIADGLVARFGQLELSKSSLRIELFYDRAPVLLHDRSVASLDLNAGMQEVAVSG